MTLRAGPIFHMMRYDVRKDFGPKPCERRHTEARRVKRYVINAIQMSAAVTTGFLLAPVLLSIRSAFFQLMHR